MLSVLFIFLFALMGNLPMTAATGLKKDRFPMISVYQELTANDGVRQNFSIFNQTKNQSNSTKNESFPYQQELLPRDIVPEKYHLWMKPNTEGKTDFRGEVTIELKCINSTKYIILHNKDLNITKYFLKKNGTSQTLDVLPMKTNPKYDQILFETKSTLVSGESYELFMAFEGHMKDADLATTEKNFGFFRRNRIKTDGTTRTYVYTVLSVNEARTAFPCFNEPIFKSRFLISIEHDSNLTAITNTPLVKQVPQGQNIVKSIFETTVNMSTYHVAFAISDFVPVSTTTARGTKLSLWVRDEVVDVVKPFLKVFSSAVTTMEEYTGVNFPYKELKFLGVQKTDFAFENFGMILVWDRSLKWNSLKEDEIRFEYFIRILNIHEIAHMWFGGLFTVKDWDEMWLYQGLTNFIQYHILEEFDKVYNSDMLNSRENVIYGLEQDSKESALPMNSKQRLTLKDITGSNSYRLYLKAASMFYMLQKLLGKTDFQQGIKSYMQKYKFKNSDAAELWESFQTMSPAFDVKTFMHEWEYKSGYPLITIKYAGNDKEGNKVYTASQSRYVDGLSPDDAKYQEKYSNDSWYVPLWYSDSSIPTKTNLIWMNKTSVNITVRSCITWIKGNAGQRGFYRVRYEKDVWDNLVKQLQSYHKAFSPCDRNGLISDAWEFWKKGKDIADITLPLKIMAYLRKERSTTPIRQGLLHFKEIAEKTRFQEDTFALLKKHLTFLFKDSMLSGTWEEPVFKRKIYGDIFQLLAYAGDQTVANVSVDIVNKWMETKQYEGDAYIRQFVYESAARYGNKTHWDFLYEQYQRVAVVNETIDIDGEQARERGRLLAGLSATKSNETIARWLNDTYLETVSNKTDIWEKLEQVSRFSPGRELAWKYFKTNFEQILQRDAKVNGDKTTSFLGFTKYFDEEKHLCDVGLFSMSKPKLWPRVVTDAPMDAIRANIKWLKMNQQHLNNFLERQKFN